MKKKLSYILTRELIFLASFIAVGYILDILFFIVKAGKAGLAIPFWKDPYFYQVWKNSLRENAQIVKFLGYPIFLIIRILLYSSKKFIGSLWTVEKPYDEGLVKNVLKQIAKELGLSKEIVTVEYRPKHNWYIIRFSHPPSCIISASLIKRYIEHKEEKVKQQITNIIFSTV